MTKTKKAPVTKPKPITVTITHPYGGSLTCGQERVVIKATSMKQLLNKLCDALDLDWKLTPNANEED